MKVGLLTFQYASNYGAQMQICASLVYLKKKQINPIVINRLPDSRKKANFRTRLIRAFSDIPFRRFRKKYVSPITRAYYSNKEMQAINQLGFDAIIVGSDQIWRSDYTGVGYNYFLDFVTNRDIRKIAYAASFGHDYLLDTDEWKQHVKMLLRDFYSISVREDSGITICMKYFGVEAIHVLDPTLLLSKFDYISEFQLKEKKPLGLITYMLDYTSLKRNLVEEVADILNLSCTDLLSYSRSKSKWIRYFINPLREPSVKKWLSRLLNAEFIVTDSFHGMVFSIIFNKRFIVLANQKRGVSRMKSLLRLLDLEDRLVDMEGSGCLSDIKKLVMKNIDFHSVNARLELNKKISDNYIVKALS